MSISLTTQAPYALLALSKHVIVPLMQEKELGKALGIAMYVTTR
jgi:hypothetical protein